MFTLPAATQLTPVAITFVRNTARVAAYAVLTEGDTIRVLNVTGSSHARRLGLTPADFEAEVPEVRRRVGRRSSRPDRVAEGRSHVADDRPTERHHRGGVVRL